MQWIGARMEVSLLKIYPEPGTMLTIQSSQQHLEVGTIYYIHFIDEERRLGEG